MNLTQNPSSLDVDFLKVKILNNFCITQDAKSIQTKFSFAITLLMILLKAIKLSSKLCKREY
jgi:hypothetical protein